MSVKSIFIMFLSSTNSKEIEGITIVDKETLFKEADIITLHISLNDDTRDFITDKEIALMKSSAIIINAARGPIINAQGLGDALKENRIAGAALDVYDIEPPLNKTNPLLNAPNTILLPHIGFATKEAFELRLGIVVKNVENFCNQ